jgi:two-component system, NtrC family, response regulator HydG
VEADEHAAAFGLSAEPVCWSLVGYAEGYGGFIHGSPVVVEEVECVAAEHRHCRAIVRHAEDVFAAGAGTAGMPDDSVSTRAVHSRVRAASSASIIGVSAPLLGARHLLEQVAGTQASVLLRARAVWARSYSRPACIR